MGGEQDKSTLPNHLSNSTRGGDGGDPDACRSAVPRRSIPLEPNRTYVGRLAPAPTGALHLGNARTFLVAWARARQAGGNLLLRLEDLDHPKVKPGAALEAYRDLAWLGLDWDLGPDESFSPQRSDQTDCAGHSHHGPDPFVQSNRMERYQTALELLRQNGSIYPCTCTRKELDTFQSAPNAGDDVRERRYPNACRDRYASAEEARAAAGSREIGWRFKVPDGLVTEFCDGFHGRQRSELESWSGDFLVARGDKASYQLAVVADDEAMGVTEVVRGDDLLPSTHRQLALYQAFGFAPPAFFHVPLVVGPDGRRLAKRHGDTRLSVLRRAEHGPGLVLGWLAFSLGWLDSPREISIAEILSIADYDAIPAGPAVVSESDLAWLGFGKVG
ncbi:MAG: tRNA glutamyl-Q(34) synthetase GluQRS [Planctomycetes bacterium]|nr:tRNA glutamyl-Q(34) synthetase GluQRS [Planctomycetota bacterium]